MSETKKEAPRFACTVITCCKTEKEEHVEGFGTYDYRILFVKRSAKSRFMPNYFVFPGGILEPSDYNFAKKTFEDAKQIAAIREVFEESNILLSTPPLSEEKKLLWRAKVQKNPGEFLNMLKEENIEADTSSLFEWSRWLTPEIEKYRYDTFFYVCGLTRPAMALAAHCEQETVHHEWINPGKILEQHAKGNYLLAPPTWITLSELSKLHTLDAVLQTAKAGRDMSIVQPVIVPDSTGVAICLPGDWRHPNRVSATSKRRVLVQAGKALTFEQSDDIIGNCWEATPHPISKL